MAQPEIANLLHSQRRPLIDRWIEAVRADSRIDSDEGLSTPELKDHMPAILDQICDLLRKGEIPEVRNTHEVRASIYTRIMQGFKGRDVVRELSLFRIILIDALMNSFVDPSTSITADSRHEADLIINLYIDEAMRYAISAYVDLARQQPEN
jgi:hypothetical protein